MLLVGNSPSYYFTVVCVHPSIHPPTINHRRLFGPSVSGQVVMLEVKSMWLFALCVIADLWVLVEYNFQPPGIRKISIYGKRAILTHAFAGVFVNVSGTLAILIYIVQHRLPYLSKWLTFADICTMLMGLGVICLAAPTAFVLSRYTPGHPTPDTIGYCAYAALWIWTAVECIIHPSEESAFTTFVIGHAYAACRGCVFVAWFVRLRSKTEQYSLRTAYSSAVLIASFVTMACVYSLQETMTFFSPLVAISLVVHSFFPFSSGRTLANLKIIESIQRKSKHPPTPKHARDASYRNWTTGIAGKVAVLWGIGQICQSPFRCYNTRPRRIFPSSRRRGGNQQGEEEQSRWCVFGKNGIAVCQPGLGRTGVKQGLIW